MEALLGNPISTPEHSISEDKWRETLKPSELWPTVVSFFTIILTTLRKLLPCLGSNVTNSVLLSKSWPGWATCMPCPTSAANGLTSTVYGNDVTPVATTVTGITPSLSYPVYRPVLNCTFAVTSIVNNHRLSWHTEQW